MIVFTISGLNPFCLYRKVFLGKGFWGLSTVLCFIVLYLNIHLKVSSLILNELQESWIDPKRVLAVLLQEQSSSLNKEEDWDLFSFPP